MISSKKLTSKAVTSNSMLPFSKLNSMLPSLWFRFNQPPHFSMFPYSMLFASINCRHQKAPYFKADIESKEGTGLTCWESFNLIKNYVSQIISNGPLCITLLEYNYNNITQPLLVADPSLGV